MRSTRRIKRIQKSAPLKRVIPQNDAALPEVSFAFAIWISGGLIGYPLQIFFRRGRLMVTAISR